MNIFTDRSFNNFLGRSLYRVLLAKVLLISVLWISTLLLGGCENDATPQRQYAILEGEKFPNVALSPIQQAASQEIVETDQYFKNKTIILNFWATWCTPCREEMPSLQRLSNKLDPAKYAVIGISGDSDLNLAKEFLLRHEISFPNFYLNEVSGAKSILQISAYPETFIIAPGGVIKKNVVGGQHWDSEEFIAILDQVSLEGLILQNKLPMGS